VKQETHDQRSEGVADSKQKEGLAKQEEGIEVVACKECKGPTEPIYKVVLIVKDDSTNEMDRCYKLLLYSYRGQGATFFHGVKPSNLHTNVDGREKIEK